MNIRQLEAFRSVIACGSVSRAAELLNVTQPAISQQINHLEQTFQVKLFDRVNNRLHPTREAEALYVEVEKVFHDLNRVARVANAIKAQRWGAISIGSFPAIGKSILPRIIANYAQHRPELEFRLQTMRSLSLIDAIATQQLDIGISFLPSDREELIDYKLKQLKAVCIVHRAHPLVQKKKITAEDLRNERFISLGQQDRARQLIDQIFSERGIDRVLQFETGQSDAAIALVSSGAGTSIIDPISAHEITDPNIVVRPFEPDIVFNTWLILPKFARKSSIVDNFVEHLKLSIS